MVSKMEHSKILVITDQDNFNQVLATILVDISVDEDEVLADPDIQKAKLGAGTNVSDLLEAVNVDYKEIYHNWLSI